MGKNIIITNTEFVHTIGQIPVDLTKYEDITSTFIVQKNLRTGYYGPSSISESTSQSPSWQVFDLVDKSEGDFIVVVPEGFYIRYVATANGSWAGEATGHRVSVDPKSTSWQYYSGQVLSAYSGATKWGMSMGLSSTSGEPALTQEYLLEQGFKVYKKNV